MHEVSLAEALLEGLDASFRGGLPGVPRRAVVEVGKLAQVHPGLLEEAFRLASEGTRWRDVALEVRELEPRMKCRVCGREEPFPSASCSGCGGEDLELVNGFDMVITQVSFDAPR